MPHVVVIKFQATANSYKILSQKSSLGLPAAYFYSLLHAQLFRENPALLSHAEMIIGTLWHPIM